MKVVNIMQLEQILGMLDEGGLPRGVGHYKVVLFGTPSRKRRGHGASKGTTSH